MSAYFIVNITILDSSNRNQYDDYIEKVKPMVESFGGKYLVRSEQITTLSPPWKPDRVIIIEFESKNDILKWLNSPQYQEIIALRTNSVQTQAIIVE